MLNVFFPFSAATLTTVAANIITNITDGDGYSKEECIYYAVLPLLNFQMKYNFSPV